MALPYGDSELLKIGCEMGVARSYIRYVALYLYQMARRASEKKRANSFDLIAELYDRARPGYPAQLVEELLCLARIPNDGRILELGCGSGKATVLFARSGHRMVCLEPGEKLAALAEYNLRLFPKVEIIRSRFEDWQVEENAFDLLISAQAFHWIERDVAFIKAARLLKKSGAMGLFWNRPDEEGAPYRQAFDQVYARYSDKIANPDADSALEVWIERQRSGIESSGAFASPLIRQYPWSLEYDADRYIELLRTYSDHMLLSETRQRKLYKAIRQEIERLGGSIMKKYVTVLFFAMRL